MSSRKLSDFNSVKPSEAYKKYSKTPLELDQPNYMKTFLTQLQSDPETYSLFLDEAKSRGLYNPKKLQNQTLDYARKDYYDNYIARDNRSFEVNREEEIKKFILYREKDYTRQERVQLHLDKLLEPNEKILYNYEPPKKEKFPLAFASGPIT